MFGAIYRKELLMSVPLQDFDQRIEVDAFDRRLAGRVDRRDDGGVRAVHAGAELLEKIAQPRVTVRLHDRDDRSGEGLACPLPHRGNFHRGIALILDYPGTPPLPHTP